MMIISGGQTGADRGALIAAKEFGAETGGWMQFWRNETMLKNKIWDAAEFACEWQGENFEIQTLPRTARSNRRGI